MSTIQLQTLHAQHADEISKGEEVYLAQLSAGPPPAEGFVHVQHGDVGKVGHARHRLVQPEALYGAVLVYGIQQHAQRQVYATDEPVAMRTSKADVDT